MKTSILRYQVFIKKEGKDYIAYAPTLGVSDFGTSIDAAKQNIHDAISCHIEGLQKTNTEVPMPDTDDVYISQTEVAITGNFRFAL